MAVVAISIASLAVALGSSGVSTAKPHHKHHKCHKHRKCHKHPTSGGTYVGQTSQGYGILIVLSSNDTGVIVHEFGVQETCADGSSGVHGPFAWSGSVTNGSFSLSTGSGQITGQVSGDGKQVAGQLTVNSAGPPPCTGSAGYTALK